MPGSSVMPFALLAPLGELGEGRHHVLAFRLPRVVAGDAVLDQDRRDVADEADGLRRPRLRGPARLRRRRLRPGFVAAGFGFAGSDGGLRLVSPPSVGRRLAAACAVFSAWGLGSSAETRLRRAMTANTETSEDRDLASDRIGTSWRFSQ